MSYVAYQNYLTFYTSPTSSTQYSLNYTFLIMMRSLQPENCTNLIQLKEIDRKLSESYSSDSNLKLDNLNVKSNGKVISMKTIAGSMLKIFMNSLRQTTAYMATNQAPTSSESLANPNKQDLREKNISGKFRMKD